MFSSPLTVSALLLLVFARLVHAQEPLGDLGPWPPGAVTLLVGMWLALGCLSDSRFDVLPPVIFARVLHKIPILRRFLALNKQAGSLVKQIVLTSLDHTGKKISQEWDTLILLPGGKEAPIVGDDAFDVSMEEAKETFNLQIKTGLDMSKFKRSFDHLMKELGFIPGEKYRMDEVLIFWQALRSYQKNPLQAEWQGGLNEALFERAIQEYKITMEQAEPVYSVGHECQPLTQTLLRVHYPDCKYDPCEVPEGSTARTEPVTARHLAAMLAFTEVVSLDRNHRINPLILCLWIWHTERQHRNDNLLIQLPPQIQFIFPQTGPDDPSQVSNTLDLSSPEWDIDGGHSRFFLPYAWYFGLWILSLATSSVITFFAIVSGGSNPNMAATLGLLFVKPYTRDSYVFTDAGYPPSWNGRKQIRWKADYACGLFQGRFYRKMGPSGNSFFRAFFVTAVSWATWRYRHVIRVALQFAPPTPAAAWVKRWAFGLEVGAWLLSMATLFAYLSRHQYKATFAWALFVVYLTSIPLLDTYRHWVLASELGLLTALPYAALIPRGVGPSYKPFVSYNFIIWSHVIASSCIYDATEQAR